MKKSAIYVLSILIITVLGLSVILPGIDMFEGFSSGFKAGLDEAYNNPESEQSLDVPYTMHFTPTVDQIFNSQDSIAFTNGTVYPVIIHEASICIPGHQFPQWIVWVTYIANIVTFVLLIILIYKFIKFILNIIKDKIFVDINARYLRHFSYCLLAIAVIQIGLIAVDIIELSELNLTLAGYEISTNAPYPWTNLLLGLISLLISIIWSRAVLIKEEQELTI